MPLKGLPIAPLTGLLDVRSMPDLLPSGSLRWRLNLQTEADGKLRRGCGWTKLLSASNYNNQDFHDQLLTFGGTTREPITLLTESESSAGIRTLWAATRSRIGRLNESTGNWQIIASGLGGGVGTDCSGPRFKAAVVGDYMFFTNNFDRPKVHRLEQPPFDDELISDVDDLEVIGLTQAALVWVWKDIVFFANVTMDNQRFTNRVVWGDYRNPLSFDPAKPESLAGYKDLNYGERVLAGLPTSTNTFLIYTTHGIWELSAVGGAQVFAWREAYPGRQNDFSGILKYENTLMDFGGEHLYLAEDRPYVYGPNRSAPEPVEWLHRGAGVLYDDLDTSTCSTHIGWFHGDEAFFSVKRNADDGCPGITLRIHTQYQVADVIDHGFTAACNFRSHPAPSIRDFVLDKLICTPAGLEAEMQSLFTRSAFENEGLPSPFATPSAAFTPTVIHTGELLHLCGSVTAAGAGTAAANTSYEYAGGRYTAGNDYYILTMMDGTTRTWKLYSDTDVLLYSNTATLAGAWSTVEGGTGPAPTITLGADVVVVEDYEKTASDSDSLCTLLGDLKLSNICSDCESPSLLVLASSGDWCLKQYGTAFYRERCANPTAVGTTGALGYTSAVGSYLLDGYDSLIRFAPLFQEKANVTVQRFKLNGIPAASASPAILHLRIGISGQTADPNTDECLIVWFTHTTRELKCVTARTAAQHLTARSIPAQPIEWAFERTGRNIFIELKIAGTGGDCVLSGVLADAKSEPTENC